MFCSDKDLKEILLLNLKHNPNHEDLVDIAEHTMCQIEDDNIRYIKDDVGRIVAYSEGYWVNSLDDINEVENSPFFPEGRKGGIFFVSNLIVDSDDKTLIWKLLSVSPEHEIICWKNSKGELKTRRRNDKLSRVSILG